MISSEIIQYKNFLTPKDNHNLIIQILKPNWEFTNSSIPTNPNAKRFWSVNNLEKDPFYSEYLFNKIKLVTGHDFHIERVYMNGHTSGSQGNPHVDSLDKRARTFLIYCNDTWTPDFGGGTTFLCDDDNVTTYPYPYSAVYFPGVIPHFAAPISSSFTGLRVTLAFKLILK